MTRKVRVLVIDDDGNLGESLKDILNEKGYKAIRVDNGMDAIEVLKKDPYGIILLDIKMLPLNGLEILKQIKKIRPESVVLMMTAYTMEATIKDCLREGAFGVLYKPVNCDILAAQIEAARQGILIPGDSNA